MDSKISIPNSLELGHIGTHIHALTQILTKSIMVIHRLREDHRVESTLKMITNKLLINKNGA